ncbi:MAG: protease complex subunit PrcB family protein [Caldisericia bacterium]|nr:protease complex subunit PrcB family protein [Caldisericia bacterium]
MKTNARVWLWIVLLTIVVITALVISKSKNKEDSNMGKSIEYNKVELFLNEENDIPTEVVIKNSQEWNQFFENEAPSVDFSKKMIVGYNLGARPNSGYSLAVDNVSETDSSIIIYATSITPGENCITMQVITYPKTFISINITKKDIKWEIGSTIEDC